MKLLIGLCSTACRMPSIAAQRTFEVEPNIWVGWGSNPQPTPIARRLSGLLESSWIRGWKKSSEHRNCEFRVLFALQLSLKGGELVQ